MKLLVFSILDVKGAVFSVPYYGKNIQTGLRSFSDLVLDRSAGVFAHPEDYNLYRIGEFDDNTGLITSLTQPEFIAKALDYVPVKREVNNGEDKKE